MSFKIPQKIEILSINLTKYVQDLYNKNYTILIKGMGERENLQNLRLSKEFLNLAPKA